MSIVCTAKRVRVMHLGSGARQVRTEHDSPWGLVRELLARSLEAVLKKLDVSTAAVSALLVLDLVLNDERLFAEVDGVLERCRDGVVGSLGLGNQALVTLNQRLEGILDLPLTDIAEGLAADRSLLCGFGGCPPLGPVLGELLEERSLDGGGLQWLLGLCACNYVS